MKKLFQIIHVLRGPLCIAVFTGLVLWIPDQTKELYRAAAEAPSDSFWRLGGAIPFFYLLAALLYFYSRILVTNWGAVNDQRVARFCAHGVMLIPFCALFFGLGSAGQSIDAFNGSTLTNQITVMRLCVPLLWVLTAFVFASCEQYHGAQRIIRFLSKCLWSFWFFPASLTLFVLSVAAFHFWGYFILPYLGPFGVIFLFSIIIVTILASASALYEIFGVPLMLILLVIAAFVEERHFNSNHDIRLADAPLIEKPHDAKSGFLSWLESRADFSNYRERHKPYPVYIVAAEGGGIYAAFHTAMLLARLQDSCPKFAQHLFAISGVSGGSVGAGVFAAQARLSAKNFLGLPCGPATVASGTFQSQTLSFFQSDLLSPLLAAALFPDLLQRFLPVKIASFDRARSIEYALEARWKETTGQDSLAQSFRDAWNPAWATPALILNATEVSQGRQEVIAPFALHMPYSPQSGAFLGARQDLPLSTAMIISARFPWLTPTGTYTFWGVTLQLADGGYFENSGVETAQSVIQSIDDALGPRREEVVIKLISLRAESPLSSTDVSTEIGSPFVTMMTTRQERGVSSFRRAFQSLCSQCSLESWSIPDPVQSHVLDMKKYPFPLGWYLSQAARSALATRLGDIANCRLGGGLRIYRWDIAMIGDCLHYSVLSDLSSN